MPESLSQHECPSAPKKCQFCNAEFPFNQFSDHLYRCSSRTEQCPRCQKYIQIRDFEHHVEQVDCLGTRNLFQEKIDRIVNEVQTSFIGSPEELEAEIAKRLAEDEDREYAENLYKRILLERSPSRDSALEEISPVKAAHDLESELRRSELSESIEKVNQDELPSIQRGLSENFLISDEEQLLNEAIMKSLQDQ